MLATARRLSIVPEARPKAEVAGTGLVDLLQAIQNNTSVPIDDAKRSITATLERGRDQGLLSRSDIVWIQQRLTEEDNRSRLNDDEQALLAKLKDHYATLPEEVKMKLSSVPVAVRYFEEFTHYSATMGASSLRTIADRANRRMGVSRKLQVRPSTVSKNIGAVLGVMYEGAN